MTRRDSPPPLDYEPPPRRQPSDRTVSAAGIAMALGVLSCTWAAIALFVPTPLLPQPVAWMLIAGTVPAALPGLLISVIAARGPWRFPATAANLLALVAAGWLVATL